MCLRISHRCAGRRWSSLPSIISNREMRWQEDCLLQLHKALTYLQKEHVQRSVGTSERARARINAWEVRDKRVIIV